MKPSLNRQTQIAAELAEEGFRMTELRLAILAIVERQEKPFSIDELRQALEKYEVDFHLASLYRELDILTNASVIQPVYFHDHIKRFEFAYDRHHHHVVCVKCDAVADVDVGDDFSDEQRNIEKKTKFTILRHSLEFFGLCNACSSASR